MVPRVSRSVEFRKKCTLLAPPEVKKYAIHESENNNERFSFLFLVYRDRTFFFLFAVYTGELKNEEQKRMEDY